MSDIARGFGLWPIVLSLTFLCQIATAALPDGRHHANIMPVPRVPRIIPPDGPVVSRNGTVLPPYHTVYHFNQLIDHNNPSLGTFKQRYWHTCEFYEPGGPIILTTPGEGNADGSEGYLTNRSINGLIAQQQNGSTIILEHRFYGFSNPRPDLSEKSLKLHTLEQAVRDLVYFANHVKLPMPGGDQVQPGKAPWILIGGSYAGALTSWTLVNKPGVFFAGYASSAVVEAILDYWAYFDPIRLYMPQNCSADVQAVISHVDQVFTGNNQTAIQALKESFGMGDVPHLDDVAGALRNNLWAWQDLQPTGSNGEFYEFCDALEVKDGESAPATGWGLGHALDAWGPYFQTYLPSFCPNQTIVDCFDTYNTSQAYWTNITIDNSARSWFWIICNQVGYLQEAAPSGYSTLVSRLIQPAYDLRQCSQMFPKTFPKPESIPTAQARIARTNLVYKGWNVKVDRLFFANGLRDPWRDCTVSATNHTIRGTNLQPIVLGDGFHCSDLSTEAGLVDPTIAMVQAKALSAMADWLATWKPSWDGNEPSGIDTGAGVNVTIDPQPTHLSSTPMKPINAFFKGVGTL